MIVDMSDFILLAVLIVLSGFFSGSETALFSLKRSDLHRCSMSGSRRERAIYEIMSKPQYILITILMGNLFVNLVSSAILTRMMLDVFHEYGHFVSIAVITPVIILLCEIFPKIAAIDNNTSVSKAVLPFLLVIHRLFYPVRMVLVKITDFFIAAFRLRIEETAITREELDIALTMGEHDGVLNKEESDFIKNVLRFSRKEAMNVMIPRTKALFIPLDCTISRAVRIFRDSGAVRAPVYRNDIDDVVGVLDSRELLPYVRGYKRAKGIDEFLHSITHYPATKPLDELLTDFLRKKIQIAIVVDEYGGTEGVVTLSSIISELFGKNRLFDGEARPSVRRIDYNTYSVPGTMQIDDFNDSFHEKIETKESETIGGYIIELLGRFPERGTIIKMRNSSLKVKSVRKNRIESIEVVAGKGPQ